MKRELLSIAVASALLAGGCADELEQPSTQELGQRLERGVRGQGTITSRDRADDIYVHENSPAQPPPTPTITPPPLP